MLRLTVTPREYLQINDNIRIVFLGGTKNHQKIMVDAPKEIKIVRGRAMEKQAETEEERRSLPNYFPKPEGR